MRPEEQNQLVINFCKEFNYKFQEAYPSLYIILGDNKEVEIFYKQKKVRIKPNNHKDEYFNLIAKLMNIFNKI